MTLTQGLGWLIVAFFALTGILNCAGSAGIRAGFERWGYPPYMHIVTGVSELLAALLMALPATRWAGLVLGFAVIAAALATVLHHREYGHAAPPAATLAVMAIWAALLVG